MEDAVTVVAELGEGPFEIVEKLEGLKPEGYLAYGFDGEAAFDGGAFAVDDVWFVVLSDKGGSDVVRLSDEEATRLWRVSVGEEATDE
jgi:hypothetical protein